MSCQIHAYTHNPVHTDHMHKHTSSLIKHTVADLVHNLKHYGNLCTQALHRIIVMTTCCAVRLAQSMWWSSSSHIHTHRRFFIVPGPQRSQGKAKNVQYAMIHPETDLVVVINGLPFWWLASEKRLLNWGFLRINVKQSSFFSPQFWPQMQGGAA